MRPRVTVLSALPHSQAQLAAGGAGPERDYARSILKLQRRSPDVIWAELGPVLEEQANALFRLCEAHDVQVVRDAGLVDLTIAARESELLVLLAHWKGARVALYPPDVLGSPVKMIPRLRDGFRGGAWRSSLSVTEIQDLHPRAARDKVAKALNDAVEGWQTWAFSGCAVERNFDGVFVSTAYGECFAREQVNDVLGSDRLIPGARLELADGLWRPSDIASCFPRNWEGLCDFVSCTSEYLTEEVKCRVPTAVFRADSRCLFPSLVLSALAESIPKLRRDLRTGDRMAAGYMDIAYALDRKHGDVSP